PQRNERTVDFDAGFLVRLAAGGYFEVFVGAGFALGDAPGSASIVPAGGMDEEHLEALAARTIQECAGRLSHGGHRDGGWGSGDSAGACSAKRGTTSGLTTW